MLTVPVSLALLPLRALSEVQFHIFQLMAVLTMQMQHVFSRFVSNLQHKAVFFLLCPLLWPATVNAHTFYLMIMLSVPLSAYICVIPEFSFVVTQILDVEWFTLATVLSLALWTQVEFWLRADVLLILAASVFLWGSITYFRGIFFRLFLVTFRRKKVS